MYKMLTVDHCASLTEEKLTDKRVQQAFDLGDPDTIMDPKRTQSLKHSVFFRNKRLRTILRTLLTYLHI